MTPNQLLQRTVKRRRGDVASDSFHYALEPRFTRHGAAAELQRWADKNHGITGCHLST